MTPTDEAAWAADMDRALTVGTRIVGWAGLCVTLYIIANIAAVWGL